MESNIPKLPTRPENSNKGTFGKVLNIAGSDYMPGAGYLSSVSALKIGAGYVELASSEKVLNIISAMSPEIVLAPLNKLAGIIKYADVISIGCGLSTDNNAQKIFDTTVNLIQNKPIIIDADGLNILSLRDYKFNNNAILTPHPKEASRLLNIDVEKILKCPGEYAIEISQKYQCITVLKGHNTVVTSTTKDIYINGTGNSALAKAGSGDVLCGMITGLVAQGMKLNEAAIVGVHLHGLTGEIASKDLSEYGVLASDLLRYIPFAIKLFNQRN